MLSFACAPTRQRTEPNDRVHLACNPQIASMNSTGLGTVLLGGAVGALITIAVAQLGRIAVAWSAVTIHDDQAKDANDDLVIWVDDTTQSLQRELVEVENDWNFRGGFSSGMHAADRAARKAGALHRYRDQRSRTQLFLAGLRAHEGVYHRIIRWARGRQDGLHLTADNQVQPFLDRWRAPVELAPGITATVLDRTTRTTADAIAELPSLKLS